LRCTLLLSVILIITFEVSHIINHSLKLINQVLRSSAEQTKGLLLLNFTIIGVVKTHKPLACP
jgi:hypothetical protein